MDHIPLYDRYVKKGSVYTENRRVAGLLGKRDSRAVKYASEGDPKWCRVSRYNVVVDPQRLDSTAPESSKSLVEIDPLLVSPGPIARRSFAG